MLANRTRPLLNSKRLTDYQQLLLRRRFSDRWGTSEVQKATNISDSAEEMAENTTINYPHKNSAQFMYRDYMRVISRKYEEPMTRKLKNIVREMFLDYAHLPKRELFQVMG